MIFLALKLFWTDLPLQLVNDLFIHNVWTQIRKIALQKNRQKFKNILVIYV